jgi:uroporphyrin-3 C-methyltransferase
MEKFKGSNSAKIQTLTQTQQQTNQQLQHQQEKLAQINDRLKQQQTKISNQQQTLQKFAEFNDNALEHWHISEASHLLQLAQFNLQWQHNITGTIALLQAVKSRLSPINNAQINKILAHIVAAIEALQQKDKLSYPAILGKLDQLKHQISELPLNITPDQSTQDSEQKAHDNIPKQSPDASKNAWIGEHYWQQTLTKLGQIFVIRHHNSKAIPLISAKQHAYLIHNIQMQLSQASWGLLHRHQEVYETSLKQAQQWASIYFDDHDPATQKVLQQLAQLQKINIAPDLPDLQASLDGLKNWLTKKQDNNASS